MTWLCSVRPSWLRANSWLVGPGRLCQHRIVLLGHLAGRSRRLAHRVEVDAEHLWRTLQAAPREVQRRTALAAHKLKLARVALSDFDGSLLTADVHRHDGATALDAGDKNALVVVGPRQLMRRQIHFFRQRAILTRDAIVQPHFPAVCLEAGPSLRQKCQKSSVVRKRGAMSDARFFDVRLRG